MSSLLKVDLKRILKDKLMIITLIVCLVMSLITPLMYKGLSMLTDDADLLGVVSGKQIFIQAFSPSGNAGLIAPILIGIIIFKDFSYGTIRNKIICGNSRVNIYFSMLISTLIVLWAVILLQALLSLLLSLAFFDYAQTAFSLKELGYILLSVFFEFLVYVLISALVNFICVWVNNIGLFIVCFVGVNMVFSIIGSIISAVTMFSEEVNLFLEFLQNINVFMPMLIGGGSTYVLKDVLYIVLTPILSSALLITLSIMIFRKKDIK